MLRPDQLTKSLWVLQNFTPGELQWYSFVATPVKHGRKPESTIDKQPRMVKGVGIPASTIYRFQHEKWRPSEITLRKLYHFYDRWNFKRLCSLGVRERDARKFYRYGPDRIKPFIYKYSAWAKRIQENNLRSRYHEHVPLECIRWGMAHSRKYGYNEWEAVARLSGLRKRRLPGPRKGYGHHRGG